MGALYRSPNATAWGSGTGTTCTTGRTGNCMAASRASAPPPEHLLMHELKPIAYPSRYFAAMPSVAWRGHAWPRPGNRRVDFTPCHRKHAACRFRQHGGAAFFFELRLKQQGMHTSLDAA